MYLKKNEKVENLYKHFPFSMQYETQLWLLRNAYGGLIKLRPNLYYTLHIKSLNQGRLDWEDMQHTRKNQMR